MIDERIIGSVKYWLENSVIKFNFCPFAKKEHLASSIHYYVVKRQDLESQLTSITEQLKYLDDHPEKETSLIIFPKGLESFFDYIDFLEMVNQLNQQLGYEGTFQLASFHPDYCFEGAMQDEASNFTNRSPVPIIHILRESSLERALERYDKPEKIPQNNIILANKLGKEVFENILTKSIKISQ